MYNHGPRRTLIVRSDFSSEVEQGCGCDRNAVVRPAREVEVVHRASLALFTFKKQAFTNVQQKNLALGKAD